jgi:hypothetical protein
MGLLQLALQKETLQQPGVLIGVPLEQQFALLDGKVISLSYTISVFLLHSDNSINVHLCLLHAFKKQCYCETQHNTASFAWLLTTLSVRQENACLKYKSKKVGLRHFSRRGPTLLSKSRYIKFPAKYSVTRVNK